MTQINAIEKFIELLRLPPTREQLHDLLSLASNILASHYAAQDGRPHPIAISKDVLAARMSVVRLTNLFSRAVNNPFPPYFFNPNKSVSKDEAFEALKGIYIDAIAYLLNNFEHGNYDFWQSPETETFLIRYGVRVRELENQGSEWLYLNAVAN